MTLVTILLPITSDTHAFEEYDRLRDLLTSKFGGATAFVRSPAEGIWHDPDAGILAHDDIVAIEVMTDGVDRSWWQELRRGLEQRLGQKEIVIRAQPMERL